MYIYDNKNTIANMRFLIFDLFCILVSFVLAIYFRMGNLLYLNTSFSSMYTQSLIVMLLTHICAVFIFGFYQTIYARGYFKEFAEVIKQNICLMFMFLIYIYLTQQGTEYSRIIYISFFVLNAILMYTYRIIFKNILRNWYRNTKAARKLLLVTTSTSVNEILSRLDLKDEVDYKLKGIAIIDKDMIGNKIQGIPVVADINNVYEFAKLTIVDEVILNLPYEEKAIHNMSEVFIDMGITAHVNVEFMPMDVPNKTVHTLGKLTVVSGSMKIQSPFQAFIKRSIDIVGALVGLLITGLISIIVIPAIKIESRGPAVFTQKRVGRNGRYFKIYKFRSMYIDAEERKKDLMEQNKMKGLMFKMDDDPRITKVGKFIRKTSIDELPQFINVLKGDMSLVGTRPPTVDEYKQYELRHKKRLSIKPGLTGMWQVNGRSNIIDFEEVVKMDAEYINSWSIGLDCRLILKTVGVLFGDKNAS